MEKLTLYHGSRQGLVGAIRPDRSDGTCDFGQGFYMGTEVRQPQTLICEAREPVFYTLSFDLTDLAVYRFGVDADWALFVAFNRGKLEQCRETALYERYRRIRSDHDVIFGKIADDRLFATMNRFFDGLVGDTALVAALTALNIGDQYCAVTERACRQIEIVDEKRFSAVELENLRLRCENQRLRGMSEADRICRERRREGESFEEVIRRLQSGGKEGA